MAALAAPCLAQSRYYNALLDGEQEVPAVTTAAKGWAVVKMDRSTRSVSVFLSTTGVTGTAAHLHIGARGQNGKIALGLTGGPGRWTGRGTLGQADFDAAWNGGSYLNVHSSANPGGEIRGQVERPRTHSFLVTLSGRQLVPPIVTGASAFGTFHAFEPDNTLIYDIRSRRIGTVTGAVLVNAAPGQNGPVVARLRVTPGGRALGALHCVSGRIIEQLKLGRIAVILQTSSRPAGEIRSALRETPVPRTVRLIGQNVVPPVRTNVIGNGWVGFTSGNRIVFQIIVNGATIRSATINEAPAGKNGPVRWTLNPTGNVINGATPPLSVTDVDKFFNKQFYFHVDTTAGSIRDQVNRPRRLPRVFGYGCKSSDGHMPAIGAPNPANFGRPFTVNLVHSFPNSPAALMLGWNRDRHLGRDLPWDLAAIGAPGCFWFINDSGLPMRAGTDALGAASVTFSIPNDSSLFGFKLLAQWAAVRTGSLVPEIGTSNALETFVGRDNGTTGRRSGR